MILFLPHTMSAVNLGHVVSFAWDTEPRQEGLVAILRLAVPDQATRDAKTVKVTGLDATMLLEVVRGLSRVTERAAGLEVTTSD